MIQLHHLAMEDDLNCMQLYPPSPSDETIFHGGPPKHILTTFGLCCFCRHLVVLLLLFGNLRKSPNSKNTRKMSDRHVGLGRICQPAAVPRAFLAAGGPIKNCFITWRWMNTV